ncbi:uncharacterized protein LY79DRAFT_594104 [Colletotrichum navitas]|uniref:Integral membrane protein n=1 Tax=Colletotrichum navitas TaxID=681940 RepID=A0AAD8PN22_9PEZI|nr:uncharacterized protein LY79DRAFT_594104 [Colletotrichum navitas]KAK1573112.1 hypothetical protein LY79DRAFT_594104 [Colletotrichum navitas]
MSAAAQRGSLAPLPDYHRRGLIILTSFSFLSAATTSLLWLFITYKFLSYRRLKWAHTRREKELRGNYSTIGLPDLTLGIDAPCAGGTGFSRLTELDSNEAQSKRPEEQEEKREEVEVRSPFPILVYNLLLADMMEAVAYALSIYWVASDGIIAPSPVCWAQGWLGSTSNLAASLFLSAISVNTFLTVGLGYKLQPWTVYATVIALWVFDFGINGAGVITSVLHPATPNESFFMRANVCGDFSSRQSDSRRLTGYHPAFLVYPFIYIGCSVPLVVGRVTSLLGIDLGIYYFAFAGSILAANGLFNSILWISTILFSAPQDVCDTGLDRFAFVRTPIRDFGHTVVISGPSSTRVPLAQISPTDNKKDWWWWRHGGMRGWGRSYASTHDMRIVITVKLTSIFIPSLEWYPVMRTRIILQMSGLPSHEGGICNGRKTGVRYIDNH